MAFSVIILFFISYLLGSFPSAYIVMKFFRKKNILLSGDKNNGALNVLRVAKSAPLALLVLALDMAKGAASALIYPFILNSDFGLSAALIGVIAGHNHSVWLRFRGGKGLAAAVGFLCITAPHLVALMVFLCAAALSIFKTAEAAGLSTVPFVAAAVILFYPNLFLPLSIACILICWRDAVKLLNTRKIAS